MAVNVLLLVATAFLAAALSALATSAQPPLLALFLLISLVTGTSGIAWQSARFRSWLPFAKPWKIRLYAMWEEGSAIRDGLMRDLQGSVEAETLARAIDWDDRMWRLVESEIGERTAMYKANQGGRLASRGMNNNHEFAANLGGRLDFVQGLAHGHIT